MAKRIYQETMKKWAIRAGIPAGVVGFALLFMYLSALGVIDVTGYSGDMVCAGTIRDPCLAYINFTAKEDFFIYPIDYDPWGRNTPFETDKELKSWKMYRSWGKGWREIKLNETCTGTWCGAPDNKGVKYSFVFRKGRDYQIKIYALKKDPIQDIKWGFGSVDPIWFGFIDVKNRTYINQLRNKDKIKSNNGKSGNDLRFESYNSLTKEILIEDEYGLIIKIRLTSPYLVSGLQASSDTKVANFYLEDWKDGKINLVDTINFYDVKDNYKPIDKTFRFKWENVTERCVKENASKEICFDEFDWIEFRFLDELPRKNINISLWANTEVLESIEWVPIIEGFEILQWAAWDISTLAYFRTKSVQANENTPNSVSWKPDGTKMIILGSQNDVVTEYDVPDAWNVTNATYLQNSLTLENANPFGLFFKPDGLKMYHTGEASEQKIYEYSLSSAWDVSSISFVRSLDVSGKTSSPFQVFFKPDGDKMYFIEPVNDKIYEYNLSSAWDISTTSFVQELYVGAKESAALGLWFKPDGLKMYVGGEADDSIHEYNLSIAWNITSEVYNQVKYIGATTPRVYGFFIRADGAKLYITDPTADEVDEYDMAIEDPTAPNVTINQPQNQSYATTTINFNVTAVDNTAVSDCNYTLNSGVTNYTMDNLADEWNDSNSSMSEGGHEAIYYCWDAAGNMNNSESRSFIVDSIYPEMTFDYPENTSYTVVTALNYTYVEANPGYCKWSDDYGVTNSTPVVMGINWTGLSSSPGSNTWTLYCNDSAGNQNSTEQTFIIDLINPKILIVYPNNNTNWTDVNLDVKYTRSDVNLAACWYSNDTYLKNTTLASCGNLTAIVWSDAQHNVTIWANDSAGNENYSRVSFTIDTINPDINITSPNNNTNWSDVNLDVKYTRSDTHLESCWFSNDTYLKNTTLSGCINITNVVWSEGKHNVTVWVNDTFGHENYSRRGFTIDTINPNINITFPQNNSNHSDIGLDVKFIRSDAYLESCWFSNDTYLKNTTLPNCGNVTSVIWSEGKHNVIIWANDSANNINLSKISFTIDTINPNINITFPINNTNHSDIYLDVNFSLFDVTIESCWYSNDTYLKNTTLPGCNNLTDIVWSYAQHNVTIWANDSTGNENFSRVSFEIYLVEESILSREVELGSNINITANSTWGLICIDVGYPGYGINYSCSSAANVSFNISFFRKTNLANGSSQIILENPSGFNTSNFSIESHQYDEVDNLTINISGANNIRDVTFYKANTTNFDRAYNGILAGKYVYLQNFTDGEGKSNFSFTTANVEIIKYFYLDDQVLVNGLMNITMNISGFEYGFDFLDNFDNYSYIDKTITTLQLDPSGVIMLANSSLAYLIYDDYDSSFGNQWVNVSATYASTIETNEYVQTDATMPVPISGTSVSRIYTNSSTNGLNLYTTDRIEFLVESIYDAVADASANTDGRSKLYFANNLIWTSSYVESYISESYGGAEESDANVTFLFEKVNKTTWAVNISGWETSSQINDACQVAATLNVNWDAGTYVVDSHPDCSFSYTLNNSFYQTINYTYAYLNESIFIESSASAPATNDPHVDNMYTRIWPLNHSMWYRNNGTVTSKSVYDSSTAIKSATFTVGAAIGSQTGEGVRWYLSPDDGDSWEEVADGVEHTFSASGQHLKWRLNFTATNIGYLNITEALKQVNISVESGSPANITFDFGDDDVIDYTIGGIFNVTNGTIEISLGSADISNSFTTLRTLYDHTYEIPLVISSDSVGTIEVSAINITYNPNPISLNVTAIQNFISNKAGRTNFSIDVGSYPGNITIKDIKFDYAGGNDTINITIHSPNYVDYVNQTNITLWYSRWDYGFVPALVEYLEFLPKSPTSKNVSAYGQSSNLTSGAILNLTNHGYGGRNANLSIYLNETLPCVNLTMSLNNSKTDGFLINDSWTNIQELSYSTTLDLWMWADYNCSYSSWFSFNPFIYFRQCCEDCVCSEELD